MVWREERLTINRSAKLCWRRSLKNWGKNWDVVAEQILILEENILYLSGTNSGRGGFGIACWKRSIQICDRLSELSDSATSRFLHFVGTNKFNNLIRAWPRDLTLENNKSPHLLFAQGSHTATINRLWNIHYSNEYFRISPDRSRDTSHCDLFLGEAFNLYPVIVNPNTEAVNSASWNPSSESISNATLWQVHTQILDPKFFSAFLMA